MLPLLPFVAGLAAGAAAVKLWRNDKATQALESARSRIREATVGGLSRIESSSAALREKLSGNEDEAGGDIGTDAAATPTATGETALPAPGDKPVAGDGA